MSDVPMLIASDGNLTWALVEKLEEEIGKLRRLCGKALGEAKEAGDRWNEAKVENAVLHRQLELMTEELERLRLREALWARSDREAKR